MNINPTVDHTDFFPHCKVKQKKMNLSDRLRRIKAQHHIFEMKGGESYNAQTLMKFLR